MRVLVANIPLPGNRFLEDLNAEIARDCDLLHSSDAFWEMDGGFDVVHLHFPEYLTFEIENADQQGLTAELVTRTAKRFGYWAEQAGRSITRHVRSLAMRLKI